MAPRRRRTEWGISCSRCDEIKPFSEFHGRAGRREGEYYAWCKACQNAARRDWAARNPRRARGHDLRSYGITNDDYDRLYREQGGRCAACGDEYPEWTPIGRPGVRHDVLFVDHDHERNVVRGLLCHWCNSGIGCFHDDPVRLAAAIGYLEATCSPSSSPTGSSSTTRRPASRSMTERSGPMSSSSL